MILVVCAVREELVGFTERPGVERFICGVGPVEAAAATARKLSLDRYAAVINAGIGGAFRGGAAVGDALILSEEAYADFGLEGEAALQLPDGATLVERATADAALLSRCAPLGFRVGKGLTVAQVTTTDATAARLRSRYGADVESMEGFAVLRAAALASVPALEVRGISNYVGDRATSRWDFTAGARAATLVLNAVLDRMPASSET